MAAKTPIISFKNFSFQYRAQKKPTLQDINLDIYPGERVLIAGPSGSGKSTLAACINGLNPFSNPGECSGTLMVDGVDAPHSSIFDLAGHVGTVLQDPDGQFIGLTVGEDIAFSLENNCTPQPEMKEIVQHAAELVGIENHLGFAPHELSGGQKQRVSLAGVMVDDVKILLFDEPLANLDPATGKQAIELIDTIQQKTDTTVLIIEHRLEDVLWRNVDRIVLVNEGRILADMRPDDLLSGSLLAENGIREPLYLTAMRYAGIAVTPEKHPAHIDSVVLDKADTARLHSWFQAEPLPAPKPAPEPLLEVRDLCFGYNKGQHTLQNVSFSIGKGEIFGVIGLSGAGKSTLVRCMNLLERPDSGDVLLNGESLLKLSKEQLRLRRQKIGMIFQHFNLLEQQTVLENVCFPLEIRGIPRKERREKALKLLDKVGLADKANAYPAQLSGGQKQRVAIARVLANEPEVILCDEATSALDPETTQTILKLLKNIRDTLGITIVVITHEMRVIQQVCTRVAVLDGGLVQEEGRVADIFAHPASRAAKRLLLVEDEEEESYAG